MRTLQEMRAQPKVAIAVPSGWAAEGAQFLPDSAEWLTGIPMTAKVPAYRAIADQLRIRIREGALREGTVLLESHLAKLFGASRITVRQALKQLQSESVLHPFDGRGLVIGSGAVPQRVEITAAQLGLAPEGLPEIHTFAWEQHYYAFEREISVQSLFGRFGLNELALARHFAIGRTVAKDLILQAQRLGLVDRDGSGWSILPLDEMRQDNLYDLRLFLEPAVVADATLQVPQAVIEDAHERLKHVRADAGRLAENIFDRLETDLHVTIMSHARNDDAFAALSRCRATMVIGKHMDDLIRQVEISDPYVDEHLRVVEAIGARDPQAAAEAMRVHLVNSKAVARRRLAAIREHVEPPFPAYVQA